MTNTLFRLAFLAALWVPAHVLGAPESSEISPSSDEYPLVEERSFVSKESWRGSTIDRVLRIPQNLVDTLIYPIEKFVIYGEKVHLPARLSDTFSNEDKTLFYYPSVQYSSDDGLAIGADFRAKHFLRRSHPLGLSAKFYANDDVTARIGYRTTRHEYQRFFSTIDALYKDNSNARFYGVGGDAQRGDRTIYTKERTHFLWDWGIHSPFLSNISWHGVFGYHSSRTDNGNPKDSREKILDLFAREDLAGFGQTFEYAQVTLGGDYDTRSREKNPSYGQLLQFRWHRFLGLSDRSRETEYSLVQARAVQLIPLPGPRRIFALGAEYRGIENADREVPFHLLPELGNETRLRGYPSGRFRDLRTLVTNFEYRYRVWDTLLPHTLYGLGTLFVDGGQVFAEAKDLDIDLWNWSGGFGFAFGYRDSVLMRLQLAFGDEGLNTSVGFDHAF